MEGPPTLRTVTSATFITSIETTRTFDDVRTNGAADETTSVKMSAVFRMKRIIGVENKMNKSAAVTNKC